ncbi:uncharacterized protein LOC127245154 [Andrographis paniculata]|uniref:uncharacterized protein LOC127245154 n=1 Tax=Andrographis paniculata TaxID=175694 RepID=UPI0021E76BDB|nr:uncharacterized protein LOC127245154 [Andrographis paniculata]
MAPSYKSAGAVRPSLIFSDVVSVCCALGFVAVLLLIGGARTEVAAGTITVTAAQQRRCEEIYVVGEGETLNTISEKCGDPYIVERNPHIHDPDDVFPGLVIKILPPPL